MRYLPWREKGQGCRRGSGLHGCNPGGRQRGFHGRGPSARQWHPYSQTREGTGNSRSCGPRTSTCGPLTCWQTRHGFGPSWAVLPGLRPGPHGNPLPAHHRGNCIPGLARPAAPHLLLLPPSLPVQHQRICPPQNPGPLSAHSSNIAPPSSWPQPLPTSLPSTRPHPRSTQLGFLQRPCTSPHGIPGCAQTFTAGVPAAHHGLEGPAETTTPNPEKVLSVSSGPGAHSRGCRVPSGPTPAQGWDRLSSLRRGVLRQGMRGFFWLLPGSRSLELREMQMPGISPEPCRIWSRFPSAVPVSGGWRTQA